MYTMYSFKSLFTCCENSQFEAQTCSIEIFYTKFHRDSVGTKLQLHNSSKSRGSEKYIHGLSCMYQTIIYFASSLPRALASPSVLNSSLAPRDWSIIKEDAS